MTPLEYLVPSRHRRELLRILRSERSGLTVRQLAKRVRVAYSNAHREVGRLTKAGLVTTKRVGKALVCRWDSRKPFAKALEPLFSSAGRPMNDETLYANLKRRGAPLVREARSGKDLSLEETLGQSLLFARHHPEVARVWPVVFAKNASRVNLEELEFVARTVGQKHALGFFLSLTGVLLKDRTLFRRAAHLRDARASQVEDFFLFEQGERAWRLAEENTPALARKWLFRLNMPFEAFESTFRKFVGGHEAFQKQRDR